MGLNFTDVMTVCSLERKILKRNIPRKFGRLPVYIAVESSVSICNIPSGIRKVSDQFKSIKATVVLPHKYGRRRRCKQAMI